LKEGGPQFAGLLVEFADPLPVQALHVGVPGPGGVCVLAFELEEAVSVRGRVKVVDSGQVPVDEDDDASLACTWVVVGRHDSCGGRFDGVPLVVGEEQFLGRIWSMLREAICQSAFEAI
jgi:hypothetical protein